MTKDTKKETADKKKAEDTAVAETAFDLAAASEWYRQNSEVQKNGVRVVRKDAFVEGIELRHGVTKAELERVHNAIIDERSAATVVAVDDLDEALEKAKKDGKSLDDLKQMSATIRLPTYGGETDLTVLASDTTKVASKGNAKENETDYGVISTVVHATQGIHRSVAESARLRIAKRLGVSVD